MTWARRWTPITPGSERTRTFTDRLHHGTIGMHSGTEMDSPRPLPAAKIQQKSSKSPEPWEWTTSGPPVEDERRTSGRRVAVCHGTPRARSKKPAAAGRNGAAEFTIYEWRFTIEERRQSTAGLVVYPHIRRYHLRCGHKIKTAPVTMLHNKPLATGRMNSSMLRKYPNGKKYAKSMTGAVTM